MKKVNADRSRPFAAAACAKGHGGGAASTQCPRTPAKAASVRTADTHAPTKIFFIQQDAFGTQPAMKNLQEKPHFLGQMKNDWKLNKNRGGKNFLATSCLVFYFTTTPHFTDTNEVLP